MGLPFRTPRKIWQLPVHEPKAGTHPAFLLEAGSPTCLYTRELVGQSPVWEARTVLRGRWETGRVKRK